MPRRPAVLAPLGTTAALAASVVDWIMHVYAAKMPVMSSGLKLGLQGFVLFGELHACSMCEELRTCEDLLAFLFFFNLPKLRRWG